MRVIYAIILLMLWVNPVSALTPEERLADPALEARARSLSLEVRCLVCQNQSVDDSTAPFALDVRKIIRQQITAGQSDDAIRDFLRARYGDFILLNPPLTANTALLWLAPFALLLIGLGGVIIFRLKKGR